MRAEYIDFDYTKTLNPEEQAWLAQFSGEYYGASIDVKADKSRPYKSAIHQTMKQVKKARDANNHRNNDVYGANRANGLLFDVASPDIKDGWYITNSSLQEDSIIANLDSGEQHEKLTLIEYLDCRAVMNEEMRRENDLYMFNNYILDPDEFYRLLNMYEKKLITKRKIEALLEQGKLQEYLNETK